jgi:phosphatidylglycerol---prolipoprotein diacylglyceryl transferase
MLPVIQIGPAIIQTSILALIIALWLGAWVGERECKRRGINANEAWNLVGLGVAVTLLSARIVFVLQNIPVYANDWGPAFALTPNALSLDYGAIAGLIAGYAYIQRRNIPLARFADALAPGGLIAAAIIAFGQFLGGDGYGMPAALPWSIQLWGQARHPVQLYDTLSAVVGLLVVWLFSQRLTRDGSLALFAIAWYSAARLFIDAWRADVSILSSGYRVTQVIALAILLATLSMMARGMSNEGQKTEGE